MRRMAFAGLAVLAVLAGGCNSGPRMEFKQFWLPAASPYGLGGSYAWVRVQKEGEYNPDYQSLLHEHVDRVLGAKGYRLADAKTADFWVRAYFGKSTHSPETGHGSFDRVRVAIEALQPGTGTVLWRGLGKTRVAYDLPPIKRRKRLKFAVEQILKDLPPPRESSGDD